MIERGKAYRCSSKKASDTFLKEAEAQGIRWSSGHRPTELDYYISGEVIYYDYHIDGLTFTRYKNTAIYNIVDYLRPGTIAYYLQQEVQEHER